MKKYINFIVMIVFVFSFSLASLATAQDNNKNDQNKNSLKDSLESKKEAFKDKIEAERLAFNQTLKNQREVFKAEVAKLKEDWKLNNASKRAKFCAGAAEMTTTKFANVVAKLDEIATKIEGEITALETDGKDTSQAEDSLNFGKQKLAEAKTKLSEIKALVPADCANMTAETFEKIKLGARDAKNLLKEGKESFRAAVKEIKVLKDEKGENGENEED